MAAKGMNASTVIAFQGASEFDRKPVRVVLTGLVDESTNVKTGPMVQSYVLPADVHPIEAQRTGADRAVCGDCPARKMNENWCYVTALPLMSIARGAPPEVDIGQGQVLVEGRALRMGAYGDPAAVPFPFWWGLTLLTRMWTAYTHAWRTCDQRFKDIAMASVEDRESALLAKRRGWRYFRAKAPGSPLLPGEILCPAQDRKTTCVECGLCSGIEGRSNVNVAIDAHGPLATKFLQPNLGNLGL